MSSSPVGLITAWTPVVVQGSMITATASCTVSVQFIFARCKMFSIQRRVSYCANRDAITLLLTFATSSTGCQFNRGSSTRCACLYTSVYISQHPSIPLRVMHPSCNISRTDSSTFSFAWQPHHAGLSDMDKEVSLSLGRIYGIHFH